MTIFRRSRLLVGSLSATLFLAACTGGSSDDGKDAAAGYDPNATVELTWWTGQTSEAQTVAEGLAAEYHTLHPNVTIKASPGAPTTDELLTKLSAGFAGDSYPDISSRR
jgi:multiple sugar transport system substrate-binding protein